MSIRLFTLGRLRGTHDGSELDWLDSQWLRAAFLLHLTLERSCTRPALLALFWPESDAEAAAHRLNQTVYALRRSLGDDCIETRGRELRAGQRLDADALQFELAVEQERWADAIALYQGPFLDGIHLADTHGFENWVDLRRSRYARMYRKACRALVDARVAAGDIKGAIAIAQAWVAPDALDDEAQHRLIQLLAQSGGRTEALKQYEAYLRILTAEGLQPLEETKQLVAAFEHTDELPAPVREPMRQARKLGKPRLVPFEALPKTAPIALERSARSRKIRAVGVVALIALTTGLEPYAAAPARASVDPMLTPEPIAVLIFHDESGNLGWLASGITRSLIDAFAAVPALRVRSLHAVWPYRDGFTPHDSIARILGVKWLVTGSVRWAGERVFARAELVDGATADLIDAHDVDGAPGQELQLIQDLVADFSHKIEPFLRERLGHEVRMQRWRLETSSVAAFELVERASELVAEKDRLVAADEFQRAWAELRRADNMLERAAQADTAWPEPAIQRAWVAEDIAYLAFGIRASTDSVAESIRRGIRQADTALRMRPGNSRALEVRGVLQLAYAQLVPPDSLHAADLTALAEQDLNAASLDVTRARALSRLSSIRMRRGELDEAELLAKQAWLADAYLEDAEQTLGTLFAITFEARRDDEADSWCDQAVQRFPHSWISARCRLLLMAWSDAEVPRAQDAWQIVNEMMRHTPKDFRPSQAAPLGILAAGVLARTGPPDSAHRVLQRTRNRAAADGLNLARSNLLGLLHLEAGVRVQLKELSAACALLQQHFRNTVADRPLLEKSRRFEALRGRCSVLTPPATSR